MPNPDFKNIFLSIDTPLDTDKKKFFLRSFTGTEEISRPFEFQLDLLSSDDSVNFDAIMGKNVTVTVNATDGSPARFFNGFISRFTQLAGDKQGAHYIAQMVPWLWFLTRTADCLIFQEKNVPDIVKDVLKRHGFDGFLETKLDASKFRKWEYSVQYRETAARFIMRLMEQEGIFFFFTHAKGAHKMVMADTPAEHKPCPGQSKFRFAPIIASGHLGGQEDTILSWQASQEIRTGKYTLNDFNFESPSTSLLVPVPSKINQGGNTKFETYDYPGEYDSREEGDFYAHRRIEEEEVPHSEVEGVSRGRTFTAGFRFDVTNSERKDQDGTYVLTSVTHTIFEGAGISDPDGATSTYTNSFTCIPVAVQFRPLRSTPRPLMQGSQTAIVVGPKGEEIFTDKFGRVKVQFHWDREGKRDDNATCFIRVSQPWAGTNWGAIFLPRIGQEVIVDFLEGDPDQPIITGRVYNADNMPPCTLPEHKTRSGVISRSTPKGSSSTFNSIIFEDKKGSELLRIHAERSKTESVEADSREYVGNDRLTNIGNDRKTRITKNDHLHVLGASLGLIEGSKSTHIQGNLVVKTDASYSLDVGTGIAVHTNQISINVDQEISINGPGGFIKIDASGVTIMGTLVKINSGGAPTVVLPAAPVTPDDPDDKHGGVKNS
jgi:type VI secretion system secreted protein VgrG